MGSWASNLIWLIAVALVGFGLFVTGYLCIPRIIETGRKRIGNLIQQVALATKKRSWAERIIWGLAGLGLLIAGCWICTLIPQQIVRVMREVPGWDWKRIVQVVDTLTNIGLLVAGCVALWSLVQGRRTLKMGMINDTRDKFASIYDALADHPELVPMFRDSTVLEAKERGQTAEREEYAFALKYFEALTAFALLRQHLPDEFDIAFPQGLWNLLRGDRGRLNELWDELKDEYPDVTRELIKDSQKQPADK